MSARDELAGVLARAGEPEKYMRTPPPERVAHYWTTLADALLASPQFARLIAAAEQRGREDSADHGMCYVSGSKALDSLIAAAKAEALREAADEAEQRGDIGKTGGYEAWDWLRDRAALTAEPVASEAEGGARDCNGYALGSSCGCASSADCPANPDAAT